MRHLTILAVTVGLVAGCSKPAAPDAAADASGSPGFTAEMPDTKEARAFAEALVDLEITGWSPTDDGVFEYRRLTFSPDGAFAADGRIEAGGEHIDCRESGTWSIASAESRNTAMMEWTVGETSCASRDAGTSLRLEMTISPTGDYRIAFR